MAKQKSLFLETTIFGDKIFGEKSRREFIRNIISGRKVHTSNFVFNQFKKTFLESLITYHTLLVDSPDPLMALRRSTKYSERISKRITQIFATLCEETSNDKEAVLERLETLIEDGFFIEFFNGIESPLIDETGCTWAEGEPKKNGDRYEFYISCSKAAPEPCKIKEFWIKFNKELDLLANSKKRAKDKELLKVVEVANLIKNKTDSPHGRNCHIFLSDAIIAVEAPADCPIYTTNKKHFEPICKAVGRKVYEEK